MAIRRWRGDAAAVAQRVHATPVSVEIGDSFTLTINGKAVSFVATAATVANVTAGLTAAWNASLVPEHQEILAQDATTHVVLSAKTAGQPFEVSASTANGGLANTQGLSVSTVTASSGPHHWDTPQNWTGGVLPANGDDIYLEAGNADIFYGLGQSAVTLNRLEIAAGYSGKVGLAANNGRYAEYRPQYLSIGAASVAIGTGEGPGTSRIKLNTGAVATSVLVEHAAPPETDAPAAVQFVGTHAANLLNVRGGSVAVAGTPGETATIATLRLGGSAQSGAHVLLGEGTTLGAVKQQGGSLSASCAAGSLEIHGGTATWSAGNIATLVIEDARLTYLGTGTLGSLNVAARGLVDFSQDLRPRTVTECNLYAGSSLQDPSKSVTFSAGIDLLECGLADVTLDLGTHVRLTRGVPA